MPARQPSVGVGRGRRGRARGSYFGNGASMYTSVHQNVAWLAPESCSRDAHTTLAPTGRPPSPRVVSDSVRAPRIARLHAGVTLGLFGSEPRFGRHGL